VDVNPWASSLLFVTPRDGWIFGPVVLVTHDGGQTWQRDGHHDTVLAATALETTVWTVEEFCARHCVLSLRQTLDLGRTWHPLTSAHPLLVGHFVQLVRENASDAWLLGGAPALLATHDGGATWHALTDPCGSPDHLLWGNGVVALPPHNLWLLCGGEPSAGNQSKAVYGSWDNGQHWKELACAWEWFKPCPAPDVGTLPSGGYVGQLFMLTPRRGVITPPTTVQKGR
jgi:photosystem II stability/assembly factor-like uncharacterized protein